MNDTQHEGSPQAEPFCDFSDLPSISCPHCQPGGPRPPTAEERAEAIVKRIERGEARTTTQATKHTGMDFADWAESMTSRPTHNGGKP